MLGLSTWLAFQASTERRNAESWQKHTLSVLDSTEDLRFSTLSIMRGERGYLLTHDEAFLEPYFDGKEQITSTLESLNSSFAENSGQYERLTRLNGSIDEYLQIIAELIELERNGMHDLAITRIQAGVGRTSIEKIHSEIDEFEAVQQDMLSVQALKATTAARRSEVFEYALGVIGLALLALGSFASIALRRSLAREAAARVELQRIANTDELTGLSNRRELLNCLDRMIYSSRRSERPLALAILDIDHFKQVNDRHGHPAGDEVIRRVAQMARQMMREHDIVGRLGGEEFGIAFPDCDAATAAKACERLREGLAVLPIFLADGSALHVTLSSGIAQLCQDDNRDRLIARADAALYNAKQSGRDQVRLAA